MTRWKASGIHFSISLMIGIVAFCLLYFVYYPQPYFAPAGAGKLVLILLGVDVILGPLLTLVVFKSGKKSLKFDLGTVATLQLSALLYGLYVMWVARPVFIVASVDRLEIVYAGNITDAAFAAAEFPEFSKEPLSGPIFAVTRRPKPGAENVEVMNITLSGSDTQFYPRYFVPPTPQILANFWRRAKKIDELPPETKSVVKAYLQSNKVLGTVMAVPMKGRIGDYTVLADIDKNDLIVALEVSAW